MNLKENVIKQPLQNYLKIIFIPSTLLQPNHLFSYITQSKIIQIHP